MKIINLNIQQQSDSSMFICEAANERLGLEVGRKAKLKREMENICFNKFHDNWWYLVFCPLNKGYNPDWLAFDHIRLKVCKDKDCSYLITREKNSRKVHWNLLINTVADLSAYEDSHTNKFFIHVDKITCFSVKRVYDYITKECDNNWKLYNDYVLKDNFNIYGILYGDY